MWSEPGPEAVKGRRYEEVTFCNTSQFVLIHSWTNGETILTDRPSLQLQALTVHQSWPFAARHVLICMAMPGPAPLHTSRAVHRGGCRGSQGWSHACGVTQYDGY